MPKIQFFPIFIISLLTHLCLYMAAHLWQPIRQEKTTALDVELVYQNEKNEKTQQIVTDTSTPLEEKINELKEKADFLSKVTRRVKEQQIARKNGETKNATPGSQGAQRENLAKRLEKMRQEEAENGIVMPLGANPNQQNVGRNVVIGDSSLSEYIPEIREGGFTSLNTDQFLFYTFYARIHEQIRNRWIANIRSALNQINRQDYANLAVRNQVSQIEIILDKNGNYQKAFVHRKADREILDLAAVSAFQKAAPFLNPPAEIVEDDGFIHLHYQFHVQFRASVLQGSN